MEDDDESNQDSIVILSQVIMDLDLPSHRRDQFNLTE